MHGGSSLRSTLLRSQRSALEILLVLMSISIPFGVINYLTCPPAQIFQPKDAPAYIPGKVAIMVLLSVQLVLSFVLRGINIRLNLQKAAALQAEKEKRGWTDEDLQREREAHAFRDLTDKQ
jgi:hypothetical protein